MSRRRLHITGLIQPDLVLLLLFPPGFPFFTEEMQCIGRRAQAAWRPASPCHRSQCHCKGEAGGRSSHHHSFLSRAATSCCTSPQIYPALVVRAPSFAVQKHWLQSKPQSSHSSKTWSNMYINKRLLYHYQPRRFSSKLVPKRAGSSNISSVFHWRDKNTTHAF